MTCYRQPFESARILVVDPQAVKRYPAWEPPEIPGKFALARGTLQPFGRSPPSGP